jgi:hypothetical protein
MEIAGLKYKFSAAPWKYVGKGGWYFISLPTDISKEIRDNLRSEEEGWGRLKATVKIGKSTWKTAIWFDTKSKAYLLPLKAEIRKSEKILPGNMLNVYIWI